MANLPDGDLATLDQFVMAVLQSVANGEITGLEARDDIMQPPDGVGSRQRSRVYTLDHVVAGGEARFRGSAMTVAPKSMVYSACYYRAIATNCITPSRSAGSSDISVLSPFITQLPRNHAV